MKNFAKFSSFILQSVQSFFHPFCKDCKLFFSYLANPKETFFFSKLLTCKNHARREKKRKQHLLFFQQSFCFFFCSLFFFYRCPKRKFSSELFLQVLLFFCSRLDLLKVKRKQNWVLGGGGLPLRIFWLFESHVHETQFFHNQTNRMSFFNFLKEGNFVICFDSYVN